MLRIDRAIDRENKDNPHYFKCRDMPNQVSPSLLKYWKPRNWYVWVFYGCLRAAARVPLRWQIALGKPMGRVLCLLFAGKRRTIRRNLEACFPELSAGELGTLCKRHHESVGIGLFELATSWYGSAEAVRNRVRVEGHEHLQAALDKGRGVLLFCGHFSAMELVHPALRPLCPRLTAMYRPMRNELMDQLILRGRLRHMDTLFSKYSVKALLKHLAGNAVVYYLADQSYQGKYSALVPFFGVPANTNTAITRILSISGAALLTIFPTRLADGSGYVATIAPPPNDLPSDDPEGDMARLTHLMEDHIRTCPEQYTWMHRRFKDLPDGYPDVYA